MISSKKDITRDLTVHTCTGLITISAIRIKLKEDYQGKPTRHEIWDFTGADISFTNSTEVKQLAHDGKSIVHSRKGGKSAIVCSEDFAFAICSLYQSFFEQEDYDVLVAVFRTLQESERWIFWEGTGAPGGGAVGAEPWVAGGRSP